MSNDKCECGCATEPKAEGDVCTCGCDRKGEAETKDSAVA